MKTVLRSSFIQPEDLLDRLFKARLNNKIEQLPDEDQKILQRMEYADDLIRSGGRYMVYKNVVEELALHFDDHKVTKRTLENDIARAKKFFLSNYKREDKEYARGVRVAWLDKLAAEAYEAKDYKSAVAAVKEGNDILGLKKEDPETPDYTQIQLMPIMVITDPTLLGVPAIDNLEDEIRMLNIPKSSSRKAQTFDEAEELGGNE